MNKMKARNKSFYGGVTPGELVKKYGSPLYVYNESILRQRCREMKGLLTYPHFSVNYSAKANSNLTLLQIIREEGLHVDAMSPGEIHVELLAGFQPEQILYIGNNVSGEEMQYAIDKGIRVSVDSLSQLEVFGRLNPGGKVIVRFNPGVGAGHHEKVVTGGKNSKFGVDARFIPEVKQIAKNFGLQVAGINQHIGSLFLESEAYLDGVKEMLSIAGQFPDLEFIDFGGGFGIPYHEQESESRLNLQVLGKQLDEELFAWVRQYGREITFMIEPGRYLVAECGTLLGTVHSSKVNYDHTYVGTDLGFNVLMRPVLYDAYHELEIYPHDGRELGNNSTISVVGNICETGDYIAKQRNLPEIIEDDIIGVLNTGAYGYVMSSNYNNRLRPAEVLIRMDGTEHLIRNRETFADLVRNFV